jgi:hypothetical protein
MPGWRRAEVAPAGWQIAEDARLRKGYVATEAYLSAHARTDLEIAVDRVLEHPDLA